jgi:PAS domain-containing protein
VVAQHEIELILMKLAASYLAMPVFLVDPAGSLLYYNEPAEVILGRRYDETGEMPLEEWSTIFVPTDETGAVIPPESLPLTQAVQHGRPAHGAFWIRGLDETVRHITVTAFPLIGQNDRNLGSLAIFWETPPL